MPALGPLGFSPEDAWGFTAIDTWWCREKITPGSGGVLVTAGGLVFIGYTLDDKLRAFNLGTGEILWSVDLPAAGTAIPVTYEAGGEQYVVIAAGGHTMFGTTLGDSVVAYRLKR